MHIARTIHHERLSAKLEFVREVNVGNVGVNVGVPQPYAFFPLVLQRRFVLAP